MIEKYKEILLLKYKKSNNTNYLSRYEHSINVMNTCLELAKIHGYKDYEKAMLCGLLHDYSKFEQFETYEKIVRKYNLDIDILDNPKGLLHAILGGYIVKDQLGIYDEELLDAITYHATGKDNMSMLSKIVYVADFIEPNRKGQFFDNIRMASKNSLEKAVAVEAKSVIDYLKMNKFSVCKYTIDCFEFYKNYL